MPVEAPEAYVRRSVVNLAINSGKKAGRERSYIHSGAVLSVEPPEVDDLWPLLGQLPPRQRAVLVLRYYLDLSEADIARVLGCRPGTVKAHASKALTRLRKESRRTASRPLFGGTW